VTDDIGKCIVVLVVNRSKLKRTLETKPTRIVPRIVLMSSPCYWKETRWFSWSLVTEWQDFSIHLGEQAEVDTLNMESDSEVLKRGGVVGNGDKESLFFWKLQDSNVLEIVCFFAGKFQGEKISVWNCWWLVLEHWMVGVRLMFPSQDVCCTPVFMVDYKSSREAELIVYAAHFSGIVVCTFRLQPFPVNILSSLEQY